MRTYIRARQPGGSYFFTLTLANRRSQLLTDHIQALGLAFRETRSRWPFRLDAWVVLPDHLHCVMTLPAGDADHSVRWSLIKAGFSRRVPSGEPIPASRRRRRERAVWQRRYWEHLIRDADDLARHLDYIHYNPVKHGHALDPAAWPHSSFRRFASRGVYPPGWMAAPGVREMALD